MRFGLIPKLLLSMLLVLAVTVGGLVAAVHGVFEENLSDYLLRVESEQIRLLADLLGQESEVERLCSGRRFGQCGLRRFLLSRPAG